jgi:hypothetical protein
MDVLVEAICLHALWASAIAESTQVVRDDPEPKRCHRRDLVMPLPTVARQAVKQKE